MTTGWSCTALKASLTDGTPEPATDGRTNAEMNCVNGPTMLESETTVLDGGFKEFARRTAQQFLTYCIAAGRGAPRGELRCIRGNLYRPHFPARYRGFQFHCTHVIGAAPMTRYTPTPKNSPVPHEEVH